MEVPGWQVQIGKCCFKQGPYHILIPRASTVSRSACLALQPREQCERERSAGLRVQGYILRLRSKDTRRSRWRVLACARALRVHAASDTPVAQHAGPASFRSRRHALFVSR